MKCSQLRTRILWGCRAQVSRDVAKICPALRRREAGVLHNADVLCRIVPFLLLILLLFVVLLTVFTEVQIRNFQFITGASVVRDGRSDSNFTSTYGLKGDYQDNFTWSPPAPVLDNYPVERGTKFAEEQLEHSWLQPLVFMAHVRPVESSKVRAEVFLYMTGVSMGTFNRNFSVVGCLVGTDVYPLLYSRLDIALCEIDREVHDGEILSVALFKDDTLMRAMEGPVTLRTGVQVTFMKGDVYQAPENTILHLDDGTNVEDLMIVRSIVNASVTPIPKEKLDSHPRYEICLATQMKPYPYLLPDWISYHRRIGVDTIYIMDNDAPENLSKKFAKMDDVEVLYWPWARSQVQGWSWMLIAARSRCEWLLLMDADEYVMFGLGENMENASKQPLRAFARKLRQSGYDEAFFQFVVMGNSGYIKRPKGPLPESFIHFKQYNNTNGKVLLRTDTEWVLSTLHSASAFEATRTFREKNTTIYPCSSEDVPRIVHYQFRSWEEFALKMRTGSASIHNYHGVGGKEVGRKPGGYINVKPEREYTHFRTIYRAVMGAEWKRERRLVRRDGSLRCFLEISETALGELVCEEEDTDSLDLHRNSTQEGSRRTA